MNNARWFGMLFVAGICMWAKTAHAAKLWEPVEWSYNNPTYSGDAYDLIATATFTHTQSGCQIRTDFFYDTGTTWKLRFTGTKAGQWSFVTHSSDPDLDGLKGTVDVEPNPGVAGFVTKYGNKWGRMGLEEAFVPQFVMYADPLAYYKDPGIIDADIQTFFVEHGFNGFHTNVLCRWFDINQTTSDNLSASPDPDPRTFKALETLLAKTNAAGGVVHIWAWGDEQRHMTPIKWGINGMVDKRLQRYICARLGPIPGWSMGYGFDLQEWVSESDLRGWHDYMQQHLGWPHYLGGRAPDMTQIYGGLDYASYQQYRPTYDTYVQGLEQLFPGKPKLFEDRFRCRKNVYSEKDYDLDMTRRGLWNSTMAGGAANIWGYAIPASRPDGTSLVYPNKHQIRTYATFWQHRFKKEMVRDNVLTDGVCLKVPNSLYIFYKEDTNSIQMDLTEMDGPHRAVAVDTKRSYREVPLGILSPGVHTFSAPAVSDWVVAVSGEPPPPMTARPD